MKLLKAPYPGGVLTLTDQELVLAGGLFGTGQTRRLALASIARVDVAPMPLSSKVLGTRLRFVRDDGNATEVEGVGPEAARRLVAALRALQPSAAIHEA